MTVDLFGLNMPILLKALNFSCSPCPVATTLELLQVALSSSWLFAEEDFQYLHIEWLTSTVSNFCAVSSLLLGDNCIIREGSKSKK